MYDGLRVFLVSHTHWDREWYMSLQPSISRYVKLMDRLLELLERNPDYRTFHMDGQVLPIKDYLELRPEKEALIRKFVTEGRLVIGPWYAPPTETFVSGEAMIRNLMRGMQEAERFGGSSHVCWIVDVLGHVSQMPMICKGFDLPAYAAWRAMPKGSKKVFKWKGADGSEVLVFYITGAYGSGYRLPDHWEDREEVLDATAFPITGLRKRLAELLEQYADRRTTCNDLITNGVDHAFAQSNLPEVLAMLREAYPNTEFLHTGIQDYVDAVCAAHKEGNIPFEVYEGEMFFEDESPVLEPINSVRTHLKVMNAEIERLLERWAEPFSTYTHFLGASYPAPEIAKAWEFVLQNHSHDTLGCSSVDPIYRHTVTRYEWARDVADEVLKEALTLICHQAASGMGLETREMRAALFNPLSIARSGVITTEIDVPKALSIQNLAVFEGEKRLPMTIREKRETIMRRYHPANGFATYVPVDRYVVCLETREVPANGYAMLTLRDDGEKAEIVTGSMIRGHRVMENETLRVTIHENGTFDVLHKPDGACYRNCNLFEDSSEVGSGFARQTVRREETIYSFGAQAEIAVVEDCAFKAAFRIRLVMQIPKAALSSENGRSPETVPVSMESVVSLVRGGKRVEVSTTIENRARDHRLRVLFPTGIDSRTVRVGQPFDVVSRDITPKDPNQYPPVPHQYPWTTHAQNGFVDFSDGVRGLAVVSDGLFEYEVLDHEEKSIALTLLRSLYKLEFGGHAVNEEERMEMAQCIGTYTYRYAVVPHTGGYEMPYLEWEDFKTPLRLFADRIPEEAVLPEYQNPLAGTELPSRASFLELTGKNVLLSAVKKQEDRNSLIVRVHNFGDTETEAKIRPTVPGFVPMEAYAVNLAETRQSQCAMKEDGAVCVRIPRHGLATIEFV